MVHMIVRVTLFTDKVNEYIHEFKNIAQYVRTEEGCLDYNLFVDAVDSRFNNEKREGVVVISERWESIDALIKHSKSQLMQNFREKVGKLRVSSSYELLTLVC